MSACDNFVEQVWRKGKCANCFQSRERHQNVDQLHNDTRLAVPANCRPKRVLIHPQSPNNQNVKALNVERTANSFKGENGKDENSREGKKNTSATCTTHSTRTDDSSKGREEASNWKSFVATKPKPVPRPKPRPPSRTAECWKSVKNRDDSPQESKDVVNDSVRLQLENSHGKSHNRPQCNANSFENSELLLSIPDHDIKESEGSYSKSNIETVCEIIADEEATVDTEDSIDMESTDGDGDDKMSSNAAVLEDSSQRQKDLSELRIETDDDSDVDGYVPMKSNIVLFTAESIQVHNIHKADVVEPNIKASHDLHGKTISGNGTVNATSTCVSESDEESEKFSGVLEFRNPLCLITNEMESGDIQIDNGACDKLNSNKVSSKSNIPKPLYVNRKASTSSSDAGSSSHDSGYENIRKSTRSDSTNSASGNASDVAANLNTEAANAVDKPSAFTETNGGFGVDSSETSNSSWGSSTWDSCSASDFRENSCEGLLVEKASGKLVVRNKADKLHSEVLNTQLIQSLAAGKGSNNAGHIYVNATAKPFTKPYKVVDISTGVSFPTLESQNDVPPLPPKEKNLKKDNLNEFKHHVYLEPSEEAPSIPDHGPPDEKKEAVPVPKGPASSSPPPSPAPSSATDKRGAIRRAPAPRPRSRAPSQFGTLPKPAPRMSKILNDVPKGENKNVTEQKLSPSLPVASSPPPPKSPVSQSVTPVKSFSPSPTQTKPTRSSTFSGPHNTAPNPTPAKAQPSPKSTLRRAFATMKKLGGKKKHRHSKTIEISAPIVVSDHFPGVFTPKETERPETVPEVKSVESEKVTEVEPEKSETAEASSVVVAETLIPRPMSPGYSLPVDALPATEGISSPIMQTIPGIGYQNFPLSKGGDTLEKPKKPPRVTKLVKPLQHSETTPADAVRHHDEEPTYLQPNQDEITLKMEAALANLNDAEILAEALSRVEQEKLGPLPAIPRSRQVRFQCEYPDVSTESPGGKPDPARRPVRVVSATLINGGSDDKGDSKSRPKLPSRPPNTKPSVHPTRERSHSFESRALMKKKPRVVRSRSLSSTNVLEKRYNKILKLQLQTLEEMILSWRDELLPDYSLNVSDTRWSDYEVCGDAMDIRCPGAILVPVKCAVFWEGNKKLLAKVEYPTSSSSHVMERSPYKHDMRVCETLPHDVNISRVLTHFTDNVSGDVIGRADCDSYETTVSITDQIPCETVADFLKRTKQEHENDPETYEKKICLLMLQLLSAIDHLHKEAVVHRDLKAENLTLLDCGVLVVSNFQFALQQVKSTRPSPFIVSKGAANDLGGNWEHLPPEILNSPEEVDLLNYEECDTFAAGCLVYEFLHRPNPFAVNRLLIQQDFDQTDLPPIPVKSQFSKGLCTIARQLLQRYPQERLSAGKALQMLQVLLWGPRELDDDSIENAISDWLETERAHTVAMIARNQLQKGCSSDEFVETYMKCQFLVDASVETTAYIYQQLDLDK